MTTPDDATPPALGDGPHGLALGPGRYPLLLVRHGQTDWARDGRHTGRTDVPLNAVGEEQARALRALLAPWDVRAVRVSPLQRARRTAELAGLGVVFGAGAVSLPMRTWRVCPSATAKLVSPVPATTSPPGLAGLVL